MLKKINLRGKTALVTGAGAVCRHPHRDPQPEPFQARRCWNHLCLGLRDGRFRAPPRLPTDDQAVASPQPSLGVRSITDLMVKPGLINLDFADVQTVMKTQAPEVP